MTGDPGPRPGRGLVAALRRRRRLVIPGAAAVVAAGLAAVLLLTDVGIPEDRYSSAPDPCQLLRDGTVRELIGQTGSPDRSGHSERHWVGLLHRRSGLWTCDLAGPALDGGSISTWVHWYTGTQFGVGRDGAERAARVFETARREFREADRAGCSYELPDARGTGCGTRSVTNWGFQLQIQRANLYISISFEGTPPDPAGYSDRWLDQRMAEVAEDVLAHLDD